MQEHQVGPVRRPEVVGAVEPEEDHDENENVKDDEGEGEDEHDVLQNLKRMRRERKMQGTPVTLAAISKFLVAVVRWKLPWLAQSRMLLTM